MESRITIEKNIKTPIRIHGFEQKFYDGSLKHNHEYQNHILSTREMSLEEKKLHGKEEEFRRIISSDSFDSRSIFNEIDISRKSARQLKIEAMKLEKEKQEAVYLNSYFPHFLADITKNINTQVIHISTDCVFSGNRGGYSENDFRDGSSFYARSKALGELEDSKNLTIRTSIIGPDIKADGIGLLNWFLQKKGEIRGYCNAIWNGISTLQLAKVINQLVNQEVSGLYNVVGQQPISKCELLQIIQRVFKLIDVVIEPWETVKVDKSLKSTRPGLDVAIPDYSVMMGEMAEWVSSNLDLYPHYYSRLYS